jgi:hypothetical protein
MAVRVILLEDGVYEEPHLGNKQRVPPARFLRVKELHLQTSRSRPQIAV